MNIGYVLRIRDNSPEQLNWLTLPSIITNTNARKKGLQPGKRYYFSVMPVLGGDNVEGIYMMIITVLLLLLQPIVEDELTTRCLGSKLVIADDRTET